MKFWSSLYKRKRKRIWHVFSPYTIPSVKLANLHWFYIAAFFTFDRHLFSQHSFGDGETEAWFVKDKYENTNFKDMASFLEWALKFKKSKIVLCLHHFVFHAVSSKRRTIETLVLMLMIQHFIFYDEAKILVMLRFYCLK